MFLKLLVFLFYLINYSYPQNEVPENDRKIFGGSNARSNQYPYQVSMRYSYSNSHFCGGSIISRSYILTASHCVFGRDSPDIYVVVGSIFLNFGGTHYNVKRIIWHEKYNDDELYPDIALVVTAKEIVYSIAVQPIPLQFKEIGGGIMGTTTGWGLTKTFPTIDREILPNNLQQINLTTISLRTCSQRLPIDDRSTLKSTHLCTLAPNGYGVCGGDSGGPFVVNGKLTGLVSWGPYTKCALGDPDVYTGVAAFRQWIESMMRS